MHNTCWWWHMISPFPVLPAHQPNTLTSNLKQIMLLFNEINCYAMGWNSCGNQLTHSLLSTEYYPHSGWGWWLTPWSPCCQWGTLSHHQSPWLLINPLETAGRAKQGIPGVYNNLSLFPNHFTQLWVSKHRGREGVWGGLWPRQTPSR